MESLIALEIIEIEIENNKVKVFHAAV